MPPPRLEHLERGFARQWFKYNWPDLLCMAIVAGLSSAIYRSPIQSTRTFPITFSTSGDIVFPQWAYPYRGWIIPAWQSGTASIAGPIVIYLIAQIRIRSAWDATNAVMGTTWACLLGSLVQVILKQLIGGFRPYFLDACQPDLSRAPTHNASGLNGVGFQKLMYTTEICTQEDSFMLKNAITSFPSGHSTAAFAGFGFLFLWTNAKLKVWADYKPSMWKVALTLLPVGCAAMIACSLTVDAAHNWYDIAAGSAIGCIMALSSYRSSYASVWDWRFNHIPLRPDESFRYEWNEKLLYKRYTLTRSAEWDERDWLEGSLSRRTSGYQSLDEVRASQSPPSPTQRRASVSQRSEQV